MLLPEIKIAVSYKNKLEKDQLIPIGSSQECYDVCKLIFNADTILWTEEFILICMNRAGSLIGYYKVSSGGTDSVIVDTKVVFTVALKCNAHSIILTHNHPSGTLKPSPADIELTKKIKAAGENLGIKVVDHLIVTQDGYYSMADEGIL